MEESPATKTAAPYVPTQITSMTNVHQTSEAGSLPRIIENRSGSGAELRAIPAPFSTQSTSSAIKAHVIREPLPQQQLPGIQEILFDMPAQMPSQHSPLCIREPESKSSQAERIHRVWRINPYACRADEIGPCHGIPGLGFIGDLLTPPGWEVGNVPINEDEAYQAYEHSRERAKKALDDSVVELESLSGEDYHKRCAERNLAWDTQLKLDNVLLKERIEVFKAYKQYPQGKIQVLATQQQRQVHLQSDISHSLQPEQAFGHTSAVHHNHHQRADAVLPPYFLASSSPHPGGMVHSRLQQMRRELHIPSSPISASSFDPMLAPGTIEAVYGYYNANKVILVELAAENEKYLQMWSERFASPAQPGQTSTSNIPPVAGLAAVPFSSIHHGYVKSDQSQPSAIQFSQAPDPGQPGPPGPYFNTPKYLSAPSGPRQQNGMQSPRAHSQFRPVSFQDRGPRKNASLHTKKKWVAKNTPKKKSIAIIDQDDGLDLSDEELSFANLPTSTISEEALEAGRNFNRAHYQPESRAVTAIQAHIAPQVQTPALSNRRGKAPVDTGKGFAISKQAADLLVAHGAKDANNASSVVAHGDNDSTEGCQNDSSQTKESTPLSSISSSSNAFSIDDPKDTTFGKKRSQLKTPRKTILAPKKRSSNAASEVSKKRTRINRDCQLVEK